MTLSIAMVIKLLKNKDLGKSSTFQPLATERISAICAASKLFKANVTFYNFICGPVMRYFILIGRE